jgi:hypothetical protein
MYSAIAELMRFVWHSEAFCSVHDRDKTIDIYIKYVCLIESLEERDLKGTLMELKILFGGTKAESLQRFWDLNERERSIIFAQANDAEFKSYVVHFLNAAGKSAASDIALRKRNCPDVRCLDKAPIHNIKTENLFAHQAYAEQSTWAKHNRLRGLGLAKSSGTFALESKLRSNRRKRFLHDVKRSKAVLEEWVEEHKDDKGFLNLFNKKYISEQRRSDMIRRALSRRRDNVQPYICTPRLFCVAYLRPVLEKKRYPGQTK